MRKLLLLAVLVSSVFASTATARGNSDYSNNYDSGYDQGYDDAEDDATDWDDHLLPSPQHDSQSASLAMCGPHTLYMDGSANTVTVDGDTWYLVDGDIRSDGAGDRLISTHYVRSEKTSNKVLSVGVMEKTKAVMLLIPDSDVYYCKHI